MMSRFLDSTVEFVTSKKFVGALAVFNGFCAVSNLYHGNIVWAVLCSALTVLCARSYKNS